MKQNIGVGQSKPFPFLAGSQKKRAHRSGNANAHGSHIRLNILHGVIYRHAGWYRPSGRIDIKLNVRFGVLAFQEKHLSDYQVSHGIIYRTTQEDNPIFKQARINIISALAVLRFLDNRGNQVLTLRVLKVFHYFLALFVFLAASKELLIISSASFAPSQPFASTYLPFSKFL